MNFIIEQFIKEKAKEKEELFREPLVGFSSPEDEIFKNVKQIVGEHHLYPKDVLENVETIVSYFIPFQKFIVDENKQSDKVSALWARTYFECNNLINDIAEGLVKLLTEKGIGATLFKATAGFSKETLQAVWSHRTAAAAAGLGKFGQNRMLIGKKGGAGRYGTVFIAKKLELSIKDEREYCLKKQGENCNYCITHCPSEALSESGFARHICYKLLQENAKKFQEYGGSDVCGKCVVGPCSYFE